MPIPQTVANTFIDEFNAAMCQPHPPSEFSLKRWERSATALLSKGPAEAADGYQLLGMMCTFSSDIEGIRENFERAIRLMPSKLVIKMNYAASLSNSLYGREAVAYLASEGVDNFLRDKEFALGVVGLMADAGLLSSAVAILDQMGDGVMLQGNVRSNMNADLLKQLASSLQLVDGGEKTLAQCMDAIHSLLRAKFSGRLFTNTPEYGYHDEIGGWIVVRLPITVEEAVEINFEIAETLANTTTGSLVHLPSISVLPYADYS